LEEVKKSLTVDIKSDGDSDDMLNYQKALLEYGMLIMNVRMLYQKGMVSVLCDAGGTFFCT
jgi:hypothetical protein